MKKILFILIVVVLISCSVSKKITEVEKGKEDTNFKPEITQHDIKVSMEYLASDELEGRATGTVGIEKAAVFIENYFKDNGIKPYFETYRDTFNLGNIIGYNIVGMIEGYDPCTGHAVKARFSYIANEIFENDEYTRVLSLSNTGAYEVDLSKFHCTQAQSVRRVGPLETGGSSEWVTQ